MNKERFQIKTASFEDAKKILEIQKRAFLDEAKIYNNYQLPQLTQSVESLEEEFNEKTFLKVILNNQIIASVRFKEIDGYVTIDRIVVQPEHQNHGIGTSILKEIEARVPNAIAFQLFTGNKSHRNIYLYKKMGYRIIKRQITDQGITFLYFEKRKNHSLDEK